MSVAEVWPPPQRRMISVEEFLTLPSDGSGRIWELVNGELRAQDPASDAHGTIQSNLNTLIATHLRSHRPGCRVVANPGVRPRLVSASNWRIPKLGVTCTPNRAGTRQIPDPVLLVEVLSPSNEEDTWSNVPLYATLPSVMEILLVSSFKVEVQLIRRGDDTLWPAGPIPVVRSGTVTLASVGLDLPVAEIYRDTHLAGEAAGAPEG